MERLWVDFSQFGNHKFLFPPFEVNVGVEPKIGVWKTPKMDGENNGKPYFLMDDLVGNTPIFGNTHVVYSSDVQKIWCGCVTPAQDFVGRPVKLFPNHP